MGPSKALCCAGLLLITSIGCSSSTKTFPVVVEIDREPEAAYWHQVVFENSDGSSALQDVDAQSRINGEVDEGGSIWFFRRDNPAGPYTGSADAVVYSNLALTQLVNTPVFRFGADPVPQPIAAMRITGRLQAEPTPSDQKSVAVFSTCSRRSAPSYLEAFEVQMVFDRRCDGKVSLLVVQFGDNGVGPQAVGYAYLPDEALLDGRVIEIQPSQWQTLRNVSVVFQNQGSYEISSATLLSELTPYSTHRGVVAGPMRAHLRVSRSGYASQTLQCPATQSVTDANVFVADLAACVGPWVALSNTEWAVDGENSAAAMVEMHSWRQPVANDEVSMTVRKISTIQASSGALQLPTLPSQLHEFQPKENFRGSSGVTFYRFQEPERDPLRHTNKLLERYADDALSSTD